MDLEIPDEEASRYSHWTYKLNNSVEIDRQDDESPLELPFILSLLPYLIIKSHFTNST